MLRDRGHNRVSAVATAAAAEHTKPPGDHPKRPGFPETASAGPFLLISPVMETREGESCRRWRRRRHRRVGCGRSDGPTRACQGGGKTVPRGGRAGFGVVLLSDWSDTKISGSAAPATRARTQVGRWRPAPTVYSHSRFVISNT